VEEAGWDGGTFGLETDCLDNRQGHLAISMVLDNEGYVSGAGEGGEFKGAVRSVGVTLLVPTPSSSLHPSL
jgi:hypothetical protein